MSHGSVRYKIGQCPTISVTVKASDWQQIVKLRKFLQCGHAISWGVSRPTVSLKVSSRKLVSDLSKFGIYVNRESVVMQLENDRHFWRGMLDGGGSLGLYKGYVKLGLTANKSNCQKFLAWTQTKAKVLPRGSNYSVTLAGSPALSVCEILYCDGIALDRRTDLYQRIRQQLCVQS